MFVQFNPSPEKPASQTQVKLPIESVHNPPIGSQGGVSESFKTDFSMLDLPVHSSRFSQNVPLPFHPAIQSHSYPPRISVQSALRSQSSVSRAHSSISLHVKPSPLNPGRQEQVKLPYVFVLLGSF